MLTKLSQNPRVVGAKQVKRAMESDRVLTVFLASDADPRVTGPIAAQCDEKGVKAELVSSMEELGKACGISVGAAVAALVKE